MKIVFFDVSNVIEVFLTEIIITEYVDGRSTSLSDALSAIAMRFIDEYLSLLAA